jgi:hypothetical protein
MNALLLPILFHRAWLIANLSAPVDSADQAPAVTFRPGIADRGVWSCAVTLRVRTGAEVNDRLLSGTLESCCEELGQILDGMLGAGTWRNL